MKIQDNRKVQPIRTTFAEAPVGSIFTNEICTGRHFLKLNTDDTRNSFCLTENRVTHFTNNSQATVVNASIVLEN
jgi:hypothetical protein